MFHLQRPATSLREFGDSAELHPWPEAILHTGRSRTGGLDVELRRVAVYTSYLAPAPEHVLVLDLPLAIVADDHLFADPWLRRRPSHTV